MTWKGFSDETRQLLTAKEKADHYIEAELGIGYDYEAMDYVDGGDNTVQSDRVAAIRREQMEQTLGKKLPD
jgi:hypothetical protein